MSADIRTQIAALHAEFATLDGSGPSRAERRAAVESYAHGAATVGDQRLRYSVESGDMQSAFTLQASHAGTVDVAPLLAALLGPKAFAAALCKFADQTPDGPAAAERASRMAAISAQLDELETAEEAMIVRSELAGSPIPRRGNARPEIVLALVDSQGDEGDAAHVQEKPRRPAHLVPAAEHESAPRPTAVRSAYLHGGRK